jgi:GNAT superfamily N-acetyltransferase
MVKNVEIVAINRNNILDRIKLCWGHLDNWKNLEVVQKSEYWIQKLNTVFAPTTFIAYINKVPVGMIEFVPQKLLKQFGLCPCRVDRDHGEVEDRYLLEKKPENYLFISCLLVNKNNQGKGVGKALLNHLLNSKIFKNFDGARVYVTERVEDWDSHIHWPTGPKEFYLKRGFVVEKVMDNPAGYMLFYKNR